MRRVQTLLGMLGVVMSKHFPKKGAIEIDESCHVQWRAPWRYLVCFAAPKHVFLRCSHTVFAVTQAFAPALLRNRGQGVTTLTRS